MAIKHMNFRDEDDEDVFYLDNLDDDLNDITPAGREAATKNIIKTIMGNEYDYDDTAKEPLCSCMNKNVIETFHLMIDQSIFESEDALDNYEEGLKLIKKRQISTDSTELIIGKVSADVLQKNIGHLRSFKKRLDLTPVCGDN